MIGGTPMLGNLHMGMCHKYKPPKLWTIPNPQNDQHFKWVQNVSPVPRHILCGHTTYHEMLLKGTLVYIQTYIYIYISYVCVYIYISYVLSFFVYQIHIHLQSSTYRICVYWHNLHLDPGPPGILRISSSEAFRGRPSTSSATRKMGIFGIQSRENHGKTMGKP